MAFNTLIVETKCPQCGSVELFRIQYKYALCRAYEYRLGDTLEQAHDYNDKEDAERALVLGVSENSCPHCHYDSDGFQDFCILIEKNKLKSVSAFRDMWEAGYLILD
jgi:hypothetical protein